MPVKGFGKLSEISFTKLFLCMEKSKKSAAGLAAAWRLFVGENKRVNRGLNAKTVVFSLLVMMLISDQKIALFGLRKWILERQTFKTLSRDSGLSIDTLQHTFYAFLQQSPVVKILKRSNVHLRLDATYFEQFCKLCYQDHDDGYTQLVRFSDGEHYSEIKEDLDNLITLGVQIESITTDGHKSILKAIKKSIPDVVVQCCLVHIQRMCLLWLTRFPRHSSGVELRQLVLMLMRIKSENDRIYWTLELRLWYDRHRDYLQEKTIHQDTGRY